MKQFPPLIPKDIDLKGVGPDQAVADIKLSSAGKNTILTGILVLSSCILVNLIHKVLGRWAYELVVSCSEPLLTELSYLFFSR